MLYIYFLSSLLHLKLHLGNISVIIYNKYHLLSLVCSCLLYTQNINCLLILNLVGLWVVLWIFVYVLQDTEDIIEHVNWWTVMFIQFDIFLWQANFGIQNMNLNLLQFVKIFKIY